MREPDREDAAEAARARPDPSVMIYLALFMLLLAFMILFNGVATREAARADALVRSLNDAFGARPNEQASDPLTLSRDAFRSQLGALLQRALPEAAAAPDRRNGDIVALAPADRLFRDGVAELHSRSAPLLQGFAGLLATPDAERRVEVEAVLRTGAALPQADGLEIRQAGALARELRRLGAPAPTVSVSLSPGDPRSVEFVFRLLPRAEAKP